MKQKLRPRYYCDHCNTSSHVRSVIAKHEATCEGIRAGKASAPESGLARQPDFAESLRLLVEREQYSDRDIAMMFDVSAERVRQWRERVGAVRTDDNAARGLFALRVWCDKTNRFIPVSRGAFHFGQYRAKVDARKTAREARHNAAQQAMAEKLRLGAERLGRTDLTTLEMYEAVFGAPAKDQSTASGMLSGTWAKRAPRKGAMSAMRQAAGLSVRPAGSPGHRAAA